jgi:hypothetical protein
VDIERHAPRIPLVPMEQLDDGLGLQRGDGRRV